MYQNTLSLCIYNPLLLRKIEDSSFLKLQVLLNMQIDYISNQLPLKPLIPQKPHFANFDYKTGGTYSQRESQESFLKTNKKYI